MSSQIPFPKTAADVAGPVPGNTMTPSYVQMVGRMAYVWGYPMVNAHNRRDAFAQAPKPCLVGGVLPFAPVGYNAMLTDYVKPDQTFIVCPNQDVVYGAGFTALDKEPTVFQVPDFGNRFFVFALYDQRTDEFAQIGQQYGTKRGFYMIVGPNWRGEPPAGISEVLRSSTDLVFCIPRVFKDDTPEDAAAVLPLLNQIAFYPLSKYDGTMKIVDWPNIPHVPAPQRTGEKGETKWVDPSKYYDELPLILKEVPALPGEETLYSWFASVWDAAAEDPKVKQELIDSFIAADRELVAPLFSFRYNGRNIGNGWTAPANASQWGTDYLNRTAIAKSSMYQNTPEETLYQFKESASDGAPLDGKNRYTIKCAKGQLPPVKGFWSLTVYDESHFFFPNPLSRFSLGTKNKHLQFAPDGSLTLYLGANSPGTDRESNWIPSPKTRFSLLLRNYWPEQSIIDGSWVPPDVNRTP